MSSHVTAKHLQNGHQTSTKMPHKKPQAPSMCNPNLALKSDCRDHVSTSVQKGLEKKEKRGKQKNSKAKQDKPNHFANKIKKICNTRQSSDFMVIARIESFIVGKGLKDALNRAEIYSKAGADAILIHSKEKTPSEIFTFATFCIAG